MNRQSKLARLPRSWRSRAAFAHLLAYCFVAVQAFGNSDDNQTGFADSDPFPLDTGEDGGTIQSGLGTSPGFSLDTRNDPSSIDFSQSGMADSDPFDLDTGGPASGHESNQSGFADSGAFELDTQDSSPSGIADSEGFTLDTRDSGGNSNQAEFGFDDSDHFQLDTRDSSGSNPNDPPAFQSDGNLSVPENQTFVFDFNATDPDGDALAYSIIGGPDQAKFDLNASTGTLTFLTPKDFEAPEDNDSDNRYEATVQVSDGTTSDALNLNVQVTDVFENQDPAFQSDGNLSVPENQTFVFDFNATDPDGDALTYSIVGGPDQAKFDLNASTGTLTFVTPKDFEAPEDNDSDNRYEAIVQVSDGTVAALLSLTVNLTDVFENHDPAFQSDGNLSVPENQTFVFDFNATDADGDALAYSIVGGPDQAKFVINATTGTLSFVTPKDFESPEDNDSDNRYEATVQVSDGTVAAILNLTVNVTDVFENQDPAFQSDGNLSVPENQTFVFDFNATDPDGDAIVYSFIGGPDQAKFVINVVTGTLSFHTPKDFEAPEDNDSDNRYEATVQVSDGTVAAILNLTVNLTDVFENQDPAFQSDGNLSVPENQTFVFDFNATDPDGDALTYSIVGGPDQAKFVINATTGTLSFVTPKDFESPEDNDSDNRYEATVQVSDGTTTDVLNLNVHVTDVFENHDPAFQSDGNLSVPENQTFVFDFNATDPDGDALAYSIVGGPDQAKFVINATTGTLTFVTPKDFESPEDNDSDNRYEAIVQVSDGTVAAILSLTVNVTDVFENHDPAFQSDGNLSVPENQTFVFDFNATDADGDALSYSLLYGDDRHLFDLNATTGTLTFVTPKDFESPEDNDSDNRYEATVQVSDGTTSDVLNLNVHLTDVFENQDPAFQSDGNLSVPENQTFVFDFNATDADGDALTYSLLYGDDHHLFDLNATTGTLSFVTTKDFESPEDNDSDNRYEATVQVSDGTTTVILNLTVNVTDVFENQPPVFTSAPNRNLPEGLLVIGELNATDPDGDSLAYSITGGADQAKFSLNLLTGALSFVSLPDFGNPSDANADNIYELTVVVTDGLLQATQNMTVHVGGVNDAPVFTSAPNRNLPEGQLVVELNATDADGDPLSYSIVGGPDQAKFDLNATSGVLTFKNVPDFENPNDANTDNLYELTVQVSDGTAQPTQNMVVQVSNVNESPVFTSANAPSVFENQTFVTELNATDPDGDVLTYSLLYGDDHHLFDLNASTGTLTFVTPKDFESPEDNDSDNRYEATVQVSDGTTTDVLNLNVHVTDVFENQTPAFQSDGNLSVPENQAFVTELNATDPDGDVLTYSLLYGDDHHLFDLNASTGTLSFVTPKDFESPEDNDSDNRYEATVQVSDGTASAILNLSVNVTDVFEAGPNVLTDLDSATTLFIVENQPIGTMVGEFYATSSNAGAPLAFSLVNGPGSDQNHLFALDANGTMRTASILDHETNATASIRIRVTSEDNASLEKEFLVQILDDPSDNYLPPGNGYQTPGGNYSSPDNGYQSPGGEYQSPEAGHDHVDGNDTEHNHPDNQQPHSFAYGPIVETFYCEKDANGNYRFGGKILTDGGEPVWEAGILISKEILFFNSLRLPAAIDPQTQEFTITHYDLEPGTTYYYRTYARNAAGENKGSLRKLKTPEAPDPSAWWTGMPEIGGGWRTSEWFGTFRMYGNGWTMHQNLGWFFPAQSPDVGLWLWKEGLGWLWTDEGVYPFMHSSAKGGWLYFYGQRQGTKLFFDYESKNWMTLENE